VLLPLLEWLLDPSPLSFCSSDWLKFFKPFDIIKKLLLSSHFNTHLHHIQTPYRWRQKKFIILHSVKTPKYHNLNNACCKNLEAFIPLNVYVMSEVSRIEILLKSKWTYNAKLVIINLLFISLHYGRFRINTNEC